MSGELQAHYKDSVEGDRLFRTKAHSIEFYTTVHFVEQFLKPGSSILELGAGHGVYSRYFVAAGHRVHATDFVAENVDVIRTSISVETDGRLTCSVTDATDLQSYETGSYDFTLCLGPLYHLRSERQRKRCILEAARVTSPGGYIAFAYINRLFAIAYTQSFGVKFNAAHYQHAMKTDWSSTDFPDDFMNISHYTTPEQITREIENCGLQILLHAPADGLYPLLKPVVEELSESEFHDLLEQHWREGRLSSSLGASGHNLIICRVRRGEQ